MSDGILNYSATNRVGKEVVNLTKETAELKGEIIKLRKENSSLGQKMLWLTIVMAIATVVGIVLTAFTALKGGGLI